MRHDFPDRNGTYTDLIRAVSGLLVAASAMWVLYIVWEFDIKLDQSLAKGEQLNACLHRGFVEDICSSLHKVASFSKLAQRHIRMALPPLLLAVATYVATLLASRLSENAQPNKNGDEDLSEC